MKLVSVSFVKSVNFFGRSIHSASVRTVGLPLGVVFTDIDLADNLVALKDSQGRVKHVPLTNVSDLELVPAQAPAPAPAQAPAKK